MPLSLAIAPAHPLRRKRGARPALEFLLLASLAVAIRPAPAVAASAPAKPSRPTAPTETLPTDPKERASWLQLQNAALKARVELAQKTEFYLLLDPASARLKLMLKGATLQSYPIEELRVGYPRVAWRRQATTSHWVGRIWWKGQLSPERERERLEIIAPPPSTAAEAESDSAAIPAIPIPPTPEEAIEVPAVYCVRYGDGLALEVLAAAPKPGEKPEPRQERPRAISVWWRNAVSAVRSGQRDSLRVQLTLSSTDAASLYRCLPPDSHLLVLPPP